MELYLLMNISIKYLGFNGHNFCIFNYAAHLHFWVMLHGMWLMGDNLYLLKKA